MHPIMTKMGGDGPHGATIDTHRRFATCVHVHASTNEDRVPVFGLSPAKGPRACIPACQKWPAEQLIVQYM
jgi:hypothetical protein